MLHYKAFEKSSILSKSMLRLEANTSSRATGLLVGGWKRAQSPDLESRKAWGKRLYVQSLPSLELADDGPHIASKDFTS